MKALCWYGRHDVRVEQVPEPTIVQPQDAVVRITHTAICGSDLHLYNRVMPGLHAGDILGHEFMGEVVAIGSEVKTLAPGDRVVVPFTISCGGCFFCQRQLWSLCDNSNPEPGEARMLYGQSPAGLYGYTHLLGGYAGGQAEYARVPFADSGPLKVPPEIPAEQVLFLSDILPTAWQAVEQCGLERGDTVAIWGCGPVGQLAVRAALLQGAGRVVVIDQIPERLALATQAQGNDGAVEAIDLRDGQVHERLMDLTAGRGPDACIDAVGLEAHGLGPDAIYDRVKQATGLVTDRIHVLRQAVRACRKGGTLSIPGVYGALADKFPIGSIFAKGLTLRCGQTHVQRYLQPLLQRIQAGEIDPSVIISHRWPLARAPEAYELFSTQRERCSKVVLEAA
jgi:threonine dehydrogenase-like Zn-dependent dehydrogenase